MNNEHSDMDSRDKPAAEEHPAEAGDEGLEKEAELTREGNGKRAEDLEEKAYGEDPPNTQFPG